MRHWVTCAGLLLLGVGAATAQDRAPPVPALPYLSASVRVAGLAGAGVAMPGYASSVFDNPSAIGPIRRLSLEGAYARLPDDSWYTTGAAAVRAGRFNVGGGYRYLRYLGDQPVTDNLQWVAAGVYRVGGAALGASAEYISVEDSSGTVYRTLTSDAGITLAFFDIAALALSLQNLGRYSLSGERVEVPSSTHLGFSMNLIDTYSNGRLLGTIETIWTAGESRRTIVGVEAGAVFGGVGLVGRLGVGAQSPASGVSRTSYGASVVLPRTRVDYAYQRRSALGRSVHLLGLSWTP
ncbi:MAG: hypothetical protein H0W15_09030 [Gemmatimonadales bacterium]|nr:hypothetical protein [Gemmatimonadales bacterium]